MSEEEGGEGRRKAEELKMEEESPSFDDFDGASKQRERESIQTRLYIVIRADSNDVVMIPYVTWQSLWSQST